MDNKYAIEWKQNRKIILFLDNASCHTIDINLTNVKLQYFPLNTTGKLQSFDQRIIQAFKTHYRKYLVKHIIASCTTAQSANDIKITYLDAVQWVNISWARVTSTTIRNTFLAVDFKISISDDTTMTTNMTTSPTNGATQNDETASSIDIEQSEELKTLNNLLQHVSIGGQTMNATDFVNIDEDVPAFREWNNNCEYVIDCDMLELDDVNDENSENDDPLSI